MPERPEPILKLQRVRKNYGGLRPLRIHELEIAPGERVSLLGLDAMAAETFVNLATGALVPDEGNVASFGRSSSAIADSAEWLTWLDRFGVVTDRVVLLEAMTVAQNLAIPYTLEVDPIDDRVWPQIRQLAREVGVEALLEIPVAAVSPVQRARLRLARALALDPALLILEHATASASPDETRVYARDIVELAEERKLTILTLTADRTFGCAVGRRVLVLHPATGHLKPLPFWSWSRLRTRLRRA